MSRTDSAGKKKILVVDDDPDLGMIVKDMYESYGYMVRLAKNADEAFACLAREPYHLILLDINLPGITGFDICLELRKLSSVPIIFASARTSEDDKITGLDMGGDDYLPKPFSLKELLSRTNSLMRRAYGYEETGTVFTLGKGSGRKLTINKGSRIVQRGGEEVSLSLKEFDLLCCMAEHMDEAMKKEDLLRQVWGTFSEVELSTLTVHIRWLREKLEEDPSNPVYIKTVWGVGYKLKSGDIK